MRVPSVLLLLPLLVQACAAPPAPGGTPVLRRATTANTGVRIASYARWNERCEPAGLPTATVTSEPGHGTLQPRPTSVTAGNRLYTGATNCRDRQVPGIELFYTPEPGYRGTDTMAYQVTEGAQTLTFAATVDVR